MSGYALLVGVPAAVAACAALVAVTWKGLRALFRVDAALPTLLSIANEFRNNGGSTLKDRLDSIDARLDDQDKKADLDRRHYDVRFARLEGIVTFSNRTRQTY